MTNPGQLTHGMPSRDPIKEAMREIAELKAQIRALAAQTNAVTQSVSLLVNNCNFSSSWTVFGSSSPLVQPANCGNLTAFLWASAGITFTTAGAISVQIAASENGGAFNGVGDAIAQGGAAGQGTSASTVYIASGLQPYAPGNYYNFGVNVAATGTYPANSGNVHCKGILIWTRS